MTTKRVQIRQSVFSDPDVTSGQHTNGPANIFLREDDSCPWYVVIDPMPLARVKKLIEQIGVHQFQTKHCAKIGD